MAAIVNPGGWSVIKRREADNERKIRRAQYAKSILRYWKKQGCQICGYVKHEAALDAHHIKSKDKEVSRITKPRQMRIELAKCICLCANCHREVHAGLHLHIPTPDTSLRDMAPESNYPLFLNIYDE